MINNKHYLLLQCIENSHNYSFENSLEKDLKKIIGNDRLMVVDNFSDGISLNYAGDFIKQAENLIIICDELMTDSLGNFSRLLNQTMKKEKVELLCLNPINKLTPFIKKMKGKSFSKREDILNLVSS